jgi:hypothetical protein
MSMAAPKQQEIAQARASRAVSRGQYEKAGVGIPDERRGYVIKAE